MIELVNLSKTYFVGKDAIEAISDINLTIEDGDIFGIIGLSGAGKSTLVRCINFLETPTSGKVIFDGVDLGSLSKSGLLNIRRQMSMIFQNFNLFEQRNALKNVCYPLEIQGVPKAEAVKKARYLLELVGLGDKEKAYPSQLSGGQKQRVAIARALATDPKVLLCDEATSALDPNTTRAVLDLIKKINKELGVTIIIITHEMKVIEQICTKVAVIDNSHVVECGNMEDVFLAPKSKIAKQLILPDSHSVENFVGKKCIRVVFDGTSVFEPLISNLTLECHSQVNILAANTKNIDGKAYGQIILQLPDDDTAVGRILRYLDQHEVPYEEASEND